MARSILLENEDARPKHGRVPEGEIGQRPNSSTGRSEDPRRRTGPRRGRPAGPQFCLS